jgi:hypothetical protein
MRSLAHIMMIKENPGAMRLAAGAERHIGNGLLQHTGGGPQVVI